MTWNELFAQLKTHDIVLKKEKSKLHIDGNSEPFVYLETKGGKYRAVSYRSIEDPVAYSSLRSICDHFDIAPSDLDS